MSVKIEVYQISYGNSFKLYNILYIYNLLKQRLRKHQMTVSRKSAFVFIMHQHFFFYIWWQGCNRNKLNTSCDPILHSMISLFRSFLITISSNSDRFLLTDYQSGAIFYFRNSLINKFYSLLIAVLRAKQYRHCAIWNIL